MKKPLAHCDPENLTPEQFTALMALSEPLALALHAGVPIWAIIQHVTNVLEKAKARHPEFS